MSTSSALGAVRYYTKDDPYFYTVDNRPLQDLAANILIVANALDNAFSGSATFTAVTTPKITFDAPTVTNIYYGGAAGRIGFAVNTTDEFGVGSGGPRIPTGSSLAWSSTVSAFGASDTFLFRDAANIIAQRNLANAQGFRIYNTFTDPSNYERLEIQWAANAVTLFTANGGTGTVRALQFGVNSTAVWELNPAGHMKPLSDSVRDVGGPSTQRLRNIYVNGQIIGGDGTVGAPLYSFADTTKGFYSQGANAVSYSTAGTEYWRFNPGSFIGINSSGSVINIRFSQTGIQDFSMSNEGTSGNIVFGGSQNPNIYEFRSSGSANTIRSYRTFTNSSNYERATLKWTGTSSGLVIATEAAGTGTLRGLQIGDPAVANTAQIAMNMITGQIDFTKSGVAIRWSIDTNGHLIAGADNTYDIGITAATRPRSIYFAGQARGADGLINAPTYAWDGDSQTGFWRAGSGEVKYSSAGTATLEFNSHGISLPSASTLGWSSTSNPGATEDIRLFRDAAGVLALRDTVNAQTMRIYNTFTDSSNYEALNIQWAGNAMLIRTTQVGTGVARALKIGTVGLNNLVFHTNNTDWWTVGSTGHITCNADNTNDIGATGATRPRDVYLGGLLQLENAATTGGIKLANTLINLDSNNNIAIRNGSNSQILHLYSTYTDAANYERLTIAATGATAYLIYTESAGTGNANRNMEIGTQGTGNFSLHSNGFNRWQVQGSSGHMFCVADNTYDLGASGANRPRSLYLGSVIVNGVNTITLTGSITLDASVGNEVTINGTTNTAYTINVPTSPITGQRLTITIKNTSGGALGVATWNAVFKMVAWTNPANATSRSIEFRYDGTNWVERMRSAADIPN